MSSLLRAGLLCSPYTYLLVSWLREDIKKTTKFWTLSEKRGAVSGTDKPFIKVKNGHVFGEGCVDGGLDSFCKKVFLISLDSFFVL